MLSLLSVRRRDPLPTTRRPDAVAVLQPLVSRLATLPDADGAALAALHLDASSAIDTLIATRVLPPRVAVRGPVSAARLSASIVGAWEVVTRPAALRSYR